MAPAKLASGMPLSVLGLSVNVTHEGVRVAVIAETALRWSQTAQDILDEGVLASSEASNMA